MAKLDLARAETEVKGSIVKADPPAWNGPKRAETYLKHMLVVPTPNVRGQVTALAETVQDRFLLCDTAGILPFFFFCAQEQALLCRHDRARLRELLWISLKIGSATHLAYDCPKKHSAVEVTKAALALAREAGCSRTSPRSTWETAWSLATQELPAQERQPWILPATLPSTAKELGLASLGAVWLPSKKTVLGREAGQWAQHVFEERHRKRQEALAWRQDSRTCPLLEVLLLLSHKIKRQERPSEAPPTLAVVAEQLRAAARSSKTGLPILTLNGLLKSDLI